MANPKNLIFYYLQRLVAFVLDKLTNLIGVFYPTQQHYLPAITDRLLLEPAIELSNKIKSRQVTAEFVMKTFIERIKTVNPHINALAQDRFAEAVLEAADVDVRVREEIEGSGPRDGISIYSQPFLGVPFTVKDSVAIKGLNFTSGSVKRKGIIAKEDADCVQILRKAGAIPIGITNVPELVIWWDSYNNLYGRTDNPYDKSRIVGGSSGGEAALQTAAASAFGVGTDLGGSIRMPSHFCGVFGHKTTPELVRSNGMYPDLSRLRQKFLSFGPICRHASDIKPLLKVLADDRADELRLDEPVNFSDLKVYCLEDLNTDPIRSRVSKEIGDAIEKACKHLEQKKATVKKIKLDLLNKGIDIWIASLADEESKKFTEELTNRNGEINLLFELLKSCFGASDHTLGSLIVAVIDRKKDADYLKENQELGVQFRKDLHKLLGNDGVLLLPTFPDAAPKHNATILKFFDAISFAPIVNILNVAVTQVPMGLNKNGLPIGFQVIAGPLNDRLTIAVAEELEKQFGGWISPSKVLC